MSTPNTAAEIVLQFADSGEDGYLFALKVKQLEELERVCGDPLGVIAQRLFTGQCGIRDVYHAIRLGLIGGGMAATHAQSKVDMYVSGCPIARIDDPSSPLAVAQAVMSAVWFGLDDVPAGEQSGEPMAGAMDA